MKRITAMIMSVIMMVALMTTLLTGCSDSGIQPKAQMKSTSQRYRRDLI